MSAEDVQTLADATAAHVEAIKAAERAHRLDAEGQLLDEPDEVSFWAAVREADATYHDTTKHLYLRGTANEGDE